MARLCNDVMGAKARFHFLIYLNWDTNQLAHSLADFRLSAGVVEIQGRLLILA
jgi:hypothetical protein